MELITGEYLVFIQSFYCLPNILSNPSNKPWTCKPLTWAFIIYVGGGGGWQVNRDDRLIRV